MRSRREPSGSTCLILLRPLKVYKYSVVSVHLRMVREPSVVPSTCRRMFAMTSPTPTYSIHSAHSTHIVIPSVLVPDLSTASLFSMHVCLLFYPTDISIAVLRT